MAAVHPAGAYPLGAIGVHHGGAPGHPEIPVVPAAHRYRACGGGAGARGRTESSSPSLRGGDVSTCCGCIRGQILSRHQPIEVGFLERFLAVDCASSAQSAAQIIREIHLAKDWGLCYARQNRSLSAWLTWFAENWFLRRRIMRAERSKGARAVLAAVVVIAIGILCLSGVERQELKTASELGSPKLVSVEELPNWGDIC